MRLRQFDKVLLSVLILLIVTAYLLYYFSTKNAGNRSAQKAKETFFITSIADTIKYVGPVYGSSCDRSFSIAHYSLHDIVVDVCKYPALRDVQTGDFFQKSNNTNECIITMMNGSQMKVSLLIEY
jgi:hypothetical protein